MNTYFDVVYISPVGIQGTHYAVEADNEFDAAAKTPVMLCYGTCYTPDQFTVISVCKSENTPITNVTISEN